MTSTLTHKGYIARLTVDVDAGVIHGQVVNARDVLTFSAKYPAELREAFAETIADYEEWCAERGETPQKPASGTLTLRLGPELHQAVANQAAKTGGSINSWITHALEAALCRQTTLTSAELDHRIRTGAREEAVLVVNARTTVGSEQQTPAWESSLLERRSFQ